jgi:dTDP-4-dehydrorhamnose reductase
MWLILGGEGQLARCMVDLLEDKGVEFVAPSRVGVDITSSTSIDLAFEKVRPTFVLNAAAWTAVDAAESHEQDAFQINAVGPANIASSALKYNALMIHVSTDYVFDGVAKSPYKTGHPPKPQNAYGRTKLSGEEAVLTIGSGIFPVVRTAWLYSEYGKNFAKTMAQYALRGQEVRVVNDQIGQPTSAHDLASLIFDLANCSLPPSVVHGTNSGSGTWYEFACKIYELLGVSRDLVIPVSSEMFPTTAKRPKYSVLDHHELLSTDVQELRDWKLGLTACIDAVRSSALKELRI